MIRKLCERCGGSGYSVYIKPKPDKKQKYNPEERVGKRIVFTPCQDCSGKGGT